MLPGVVQGHVVTGRALGVPERVLVEGRFVFDPSFEGCGGGWASTPRDLARWARALFGGEVLSADSMTSLFTTVPAEPLGPGLRYGLGVMVEETDLGPLLGHDGFMPGYLTSMGYLPRVDLALALQTNTDDLARLGEPLRAALVRVAGVALEALVP